MSDDRRRDDSAPRGRARSQADDRPRPAGRPARGPRPGAKPGRDSRTGGGPGRGPRPGGPRERGAGGYDDRRSSSDRGDAPGRRALSNQGGETVVAGDPELSDLLADAMDVADIDPDALTHGFHSYPARMHYMIARRLIAGLCPQGGRVLDPFCGSGTTLVEARLAGCDAMGTDLNPLAVELARLKSAKVPEDDVALLRRTAAEVAQASEARVRTRQEAHADLPSQELRFYPAHILKEMAGLFEEIDAVEQERIKEALRLVFSSMVVKFSSQRSDTTDRFEKRRLRKGLPTEFFARKSEELADRLAEVAPKMRGPRPFVQLADARDVDRLVGNKVDLVLSSPPYGGTYDYVEHHRRRFAWLGLDPRPLNFGEIGARRNADDPRRFESEVRRVLTSCRRVIAPTGKLVWLMGDGEAAGRRVAADQLIERLAPQAGFVPVALASQDRPDFAGGPARREHLLLLEPGDMPPSRPERSDSGRGREGRPDRRDTEGRGRDARGPAPGSSSHPSGRRSR